MAKKKSKRIELGVTGSADDSASKNGPTGSGLTHSPFASLRGSLGATSGEVRKDATGDVGSAGPGTGSSPRESAPMGGTIVVRHERKGHGGKTVTVADLSRADWSAQHDLDELAKSLRKALGAGARAGDQSITVQGDQVERVAAFFKESFRANVTLGTR